jgi:type I restriction enzyme R subunit
MTDPHKEKVFEDELVAYLMTHGWLAGDWKKYDRELALYPEDVTGWLRDTQPKEWKKLEAQHGKEADAMCLKRIAQVIDKEGSLAVLRHGFKDVSAHFDMCQFRPSYGLNPEIVQRYKKVRLRVVRQVHYSLNNENSIDLVFFVNGIPVATAELKTDFTQKVQDAIRQYKYDRLPKDPATRREEPLLAFKRRALVHFAVSTDEVYMATELRGKDTVFLPFNKGYNEGAGNPPNPNGYRTSYLWEQILARDTWLEILGRFVHLAKEEKPDRTGKHVVRETLIFPRYHQWDAVTKLIDAAQAEKSGNKYLIQHSAGSGKSNSIAWLAHHLAGLHDNKDNKIFDSIIVVTDRAILDAQLQDTIYQFEHKQGVVCRIKKEGVKSTQLVDALVKKLPIIIVTLQTFPFVLDAIREQTSLRKRTFAVIADEAHSSQTGKTARKLKQVLSSEQIAEDEEVSTEDVLHAQAQGGLLPKNVSFFAFTATPKAKTLELFGRPGSNGKPQSFHVYTMQQAIEEGFILDVLRNYTPYKLAFKLAHNGKEYDDETVDKSEAVISLMRWVRLHPYNISQKVQIIVEHFRHNILLPRLLNGEAKAMVVTASRPEAVRYKLAMEKYIREQRYQGIGILGAFSGEVSDPETKIPYTEASINPQLKGQDIREAFDTPEYSVLIVANKYQTGFDQPKLTAMYVDKKLDGVAAVQTLSRLNRTYPGKEQVYILDFVNDPQTIREAFLPFYKKAELADVSDPNIMHDMQAKLDASRIYTVQEVNLFADAWVQGSQKDMQAHIAPAVDRFRGWYKDAEGKKDRKAMDELDVFRKDVISFVRAYDFLSQIIDYGDTTLEKHALFFRNLTPWLREERRHDPLDLSSVQLTHYRLKKKDAQRIDLKDNSADTKLEPAFAGIGSGKAYEKEQAQLSEIISKINDLFEGELTEADFIGFTTYLSKKMLESDVLAKQAAANTKEQFAASPDFKRAMINATIEGMGNHQAMGKQLLGDEGKQREFAKIIAGYLYDQFAKNQQQSDVA